MSDLDFEILDGCGICGDLGHTAWSCPNQTKPTNKISKENEQDEILLEHRNGWLENMGRMVQEAILYWVQQSHRGVLAMKTTNHIVSIDGVQP